MKPLFIRADATIDIGVGHIMRCLALAQAWQDKSGKATFISHCESDALRQRLIEGGMNLLNIEKSHPDPSDLGQTLKKLSAMNYQPSANCWIVIDGYHFDTTYQKCLKDAGYKLLCIDDYGHAEHYYADIVLNQNISAEESFYIHCEPYTRLLLGTRYALLRREFKQWCGWQREIPAIAHKVLVTMGGGDQDNVTLKVIHALKQIDLSGLEAKIVVGPANPNLQVLVREIGEYSNLQIITNATNMPEMMAWADIAVSAGGSTCWEMALMGLPQVIICLADNQISNAEALEREAISVDLGWHQDITEERIAAELKILMLNSAKRLLMSQKSKALVDGNGGQRISNVITDNLLKLRPMHWEDCERVWGWVNDLSVRSGSFSETLITWKEHICWFRERSNSPFFYMALNQEDLPVGQVRFDQKESETIISLMIDGSFRNSGYGTNLIRIGCEKLFSNSNVMTVHAYLKPDNKASQTAFLRAGFKERPVTVYQGHSACHFILEKYQICI